jgi:hypothetical protein
MPRHFRHNPGGAHHALASWLPSRSCSAESDSNEGGYFLRSDSPKKLKAAPPVEILIIGEYPYSLGFE